MSISITLQCNVVPLFDKNELQELSHYLANSVMIPYGPSHITHSVVDVEQRHSLVAWGGR